MSRRLIPLAVLLGIATHGTALGQISDPLLPPDAKPGECYARVLEPDRYETYGDSMEVEPENVSYRTIPASYEWATREVLTHAEGETLKVVPARYAMETETIVVKEASKRLVAYPAKFKTVTEKVLVKPAYVTWKKGRGLIERIDEATGEIVCRVEVPAEYETVTRRVLVHEGGVREEIIPALTKIVKKRVMVEPPKTVKTVIPAKYQSVRYQKLKSPAQQLREVTPAKFASVTKTRRVSEGRLRWRSVLCETNAGSVIMTDVQRALKRAGHNPGPIDGVIGRETMAALVNFQEANNLASGQLSMETLKVLGVRASQ